MKDNENHPIVRGYRSKRAQKLDEKRADKAAKKAKREQLTADEIKFVRELAANPRLSKGEAAQRLGLDHVPSRPAVKKFMAEEVGAARRKTLSEIEVDLPRVLLEVKRLALVDMGDLLDSDGAILPFEAMDEDTRRAIVGIDSHELFERKQGGEQELKGYARKVKFDKTKALEMLMRYHGAFDGQGKDQKDRLGELMSVFQAGPVKTKS